jgi:hypothetical protein
VSYVSIRSIWPVCVLLAVAALSAGCAEKVVVAWRTFSRGIGPVREQGEAKVSIRARQVMDPEPRDLQAHSALAIGAQRGSPMVPKKPLELHLLWLAARDFPAI